MKRRLFATLALVLAVVSLVPPGTARAANSVSSFKGLTAVALFSSTDAAGCTTDAFVLATNSIWSDSSGSTSAESSAMVTIARSGNCADMLGTFDGSATLPGGAFNVADGLTRATLNTPVIVCNPDTLACFDLTVALAWKGVSGLTVQQNLDRITVGKCTIKTVSSGRTRLAVAAGRIEYATTNFTSAPSMDAFIELAASGQMQKGCA